MRHNIEFRTEDGVILRGWHYLPERARATPTVVMAHGYSAVKEMYLERFAEVFAEAGVGAVVFDNRNFGASDGEPRQEIDPWQQIRDYRDAITWASGLPEVDAERIGIWGSSYSGAHVLVVGAIDRRVKCVVAQVPLISGHANARRLIRADFIAQVQTACLEDRRARYQGKPPGMNQWSPKTLWGPPCCQPQTLGSGSPKPLTPVRPLGATRSRCARSRCSWNTNPAHTSPTSARRH